jgi:hypothetical protein
MTFFWLRRPGEHRSSTESHPFRLCDVQVFIGNDRLDPLACDLADLADLNKVTFVTLTFTTQKNGVRGESIGQAQSKHLFGCPVVSGVNGVRYLRLQASPPEAPSFAVRNTTSTAWVSMPTMSHLAPVLPVVPWSCSVALSTPVSFNVLVVGA